MRKIIAAALLALVAMGAFAQSGEGGEAAANPFAFKAGINLGTDVLLTGPDDLDGNPTSEAWTRLGFQPDLSFGKFGIGIDLSLRFKLYPSPGEAIEVYPGDWVPDYEGNGRNVFDVYLPKLLYLRYGLKGEDPLYAKLGSISDLTLGNGFIMGSYSNMRFMPETRIFGLDLGLDGSLFSFPYVGLELATGNLARFDVLGARLFVRPLVGTEIPILKNAQVGLTVVADRDPYLYTEDPVSLGLVASADPIAVFGADITVPILGGKLFPLAAFADVAFEPNSSAGAMIGAGGRLVGVILYGAQLRLLQEGFIPAYFDGNYDLYRAFKYDYLETSSGGDFFAGWYASLGTSFLEDKILFLASLDGPFKAIPSNPLTAGQGDYPHAKAVARLGEGLLGGFFFDASYEKYKIGSKASFFEDLVDPTDAVVGMAINYKTGASVLTMQYDAKWDASLGEFVVTSSLQASMQF